MASARISPRPQFMGVRGQTQEFLGRVEEEATAVGLVPPGPTCHPSVHRAAAGRILTEEEQREGESSSRRPSLPSPPQAMVGARVCPRPGFVRVEGQSQEFLDRMREVAVSVGGKAGLVEPVPACDPSDHRAQSGQELEESEVSLDGEDFRARLQRLIHGDEGDGIDLSEAWEVLEAQDQEKDIGEEQVLLAGQELTLVDMEQAGSTTRAGTQVRELQQTLVDMEQAGSTTRAGTQVRELQQTLVDTEQAGSTTRAVLLSQAEVSEGLDRVLEIGAGRSRGGRRDSPTGRRAGESKYISANQPNDSGAGYW